ncbi:type I-E CRISPR-associated protein Cas6/Cse3/CasE [Streptoalloteichus hindustanus]|uniref:CRISPR-associated protein, Cse3 family n=1 Tax=Streptoalloteichus hindustanus TaxID=2017 RepID=A0A1M5LCM0_STRHI|nr:type I-E CRISPR-associated protein Cas6/Cse3/CasE [Streptoalloteichus hindustanus]SHG62758.1 CRISPR-associated protein, Cse3 family [Streptoalloteichus hindustanus]
MFLTKLTVNVTSREFRRDFADVHDMHRTVMSGFPEVTSENPARLSHGVLWRLDGTQSGFLLYVQSHTQPDWGRLPAGYLAQPAEIRSIQPVLDAVTAGRRFAFRLVANATRAIKSDPLPDGEVRAMRVPHRKPEKQIEWLARQGERHGFVIPLATNGQPDLAPSPCRPLRGRIRQTSGNQITIEPVRFDGRLIVTDPDAFSAALRDGVGRAKAYGCGLLSLARTQ